MVKFNIYIATFTIPAYFKGLTRDRQPCPIYKPGIENGFPFRIDWFLG